MAGHFPIGSGGFSYLFPNKITKERIESMTDFKREEGVKSGDIIQRLPVDEYRMDEDHGKVDAYVLYIYRNDIDDFSYEIHLDKNLNINQVYQVL